MITSFLIGGVGFNQTSIAGGGQAGVTAGEMVLADLFDCCFYNGSDGVNGLVNGAFTIAPAVTPSVNYSQHLIGELLGGVFVATTTNNQMQLGGVVMNS